MAFCIVAAGFGASVLVSFWRLYYGISLSDESFYVALQYRLAMGDRLFVDELNTLQLFAALTYPVVKAYVGILGTGGLVLFLRACFFCFVLAQSSLVFHLFKKRVGLASALALAALPIGFVPYCIPSLSYNTLGVGFCMAGSLLLFQSLGREPGPLRTSSRSSAVSAGLCHGLCVVAFPTLACVVLLSWFILMCRRKSRSILGAYTTGGALVAVPLLLLFPWQAFQNAMAFTAGRFSTLSGWSGAKLYALVRDFYYWGPSKPWIAGITILSLASRKKRFAALTCALIPLSVWVGTHITEGTLQMALYLLCLAPFAFCFVADTPQARTLLLLVWLPSLVGALATGFTSTNATRASGLGAFAGALCCVLFLMEGIQKRVGLKALGALPAVFCAGFFFAHTWKVIYRDAPIQELTAAVSMGPFDRIYTTPKRKEFIESLQSDLRQVENEEGRVVFFDALPAGYLMTRMRPAAPTVWNCIQFSVGTDKHRCLDFYRSHLSPNNVAVQLIGVTEDVALLDFVQRYHTLWREHVDYRIFTGTANRQKLAERKG
ncbi:MAG: hypothetical protein KDD51_11245 [Bdellovibrionales bacterium]|nr:hypothetical protein [Bdellovibrionales bacterium]